MGDIGGWEVQIFRACIRPLGVVRRCSRRRIGTGRGVRGGGVGVGGVRGGVGGVRGGIAVRGLLGWFLRRRGRDYGIGIQQGCNMMQHLFEFDMYKHKIDR